MCLWFPERVYKHGLKSVLANTCWYRWRLNQYLQLTRLGPVLLKIIQKIDRPKYWSRSCIDESSSKYRSYPPKYRPRLIFENISLEAQISLLSLFIPPSHFPKWLNIRKKIFLSCRGRETKNRERALSL